MSLSVTNESLSACDTSGTVAALTPVLAIQECIPKN